MDQQFFKSGQAIGYILTSIPLAHVLSSSLFVWAYCAGFGARLSAHISVSDLFATSISDMVRVYLLALIIPAGAVLSRYATGKPYAVDVIAQITDPSKRAVSQKHVRQSRTLIMVLVACLPFIVAYRQIGEISAGRPISFMSLWTATAFPAAVIIMIICERINAAARTYEVANIIIGFVIGASLLGLDKGHQDRYSVYNEARATSSLCKNGAVLRRLSERYLVVRPDGVKAIIDMDCNVKFVIPEPDRSIPLPKLITGFFEVPRIKSLR